MHECRAAFWQTNAGRSLREFFLRKRGRKHEPNPHPDPDRRGSSCWTRPEGCSAAISVSTSSRGVGERNGSLCTPRGRHVIRAKIGTGARLNTVFVERRPTGEVYSPELAVRFPDRDWILTRILWLSGCEPGFNRLGEVDTMRRFIYIHGCPDSAVMGKPGLDRLRAHAQRRPGRPVRPGVRRHPREHLRVALPPGGVPGRCAPRQFSLESRPISTPGQGEKAHAAGRQGFHHHRRGARHRPRHGPQVRRAKGPWSSSATWSRRR